MADERRQGSEPVWRSLSYLLVRHATADSTRPEAGLTPQGRAEAEALARRLGRCSFDAVWSSDLPRAVETTRMLLSERGVVPWQQSAALREVERPEALDPVADPVGYGAWERETVARLAGSLAEWLGMVARGVGEDGPHPVDLPSGRSTPLPRGEGIPGLPLPLGEGRGEGCSQSTILVVSHGGPLRVLLCLLLGLPPEHQWAFRLDRAGLTVVERAEDMGTLTLLNDRCHLNSGAHGRLT